MTKNIWTMFSMKRAQAKDQVFLMREYESADWQRSIMPKGTGNPTNLQFYIF